MEAISIILFCMQAASVLASGVPFSELQFADNALEPYIDNMTMYLHHNKHYAGQVRGVNKALDTCGIAIHSCEELVDDILPLVGTLQRPTQCPLTWPTLVRTVRNSGGGAYNHNLFWDILTPASKSNVGDIGKDLIKEIEEGFGSVEEFKETFKKAALSVFGSGWAWLVYDGEMLKILTTANQDNPFMTLDQFLCTDTIPAGLQSCNQLQKDGKCWDSYVVPAGNCLRSCNSCTDFVKVTPILNLDMWEHAHYLLYNNRRADYVDAFMNVINWAHVDKLFMQAYKN